MKAVKETEKAVAINAVASFEYAPASGFTSSMVRDGGFKTLVWIPKSQIVDGNPSNWILGKKREQLFDDNNDSFRFPYIIEHSFEVRFYDADNNEVCGVKSEKEIEIEAKKSHLFRMGCVKHDALVAKAKSLGIKGVRQNLRTETLEKMIAEAEAQKSEVKEEVNDDVVVTFDEEVEVEDFTEEELDEVVDSIIERGKVEEYVIVTANVTKDNEIVIGCEVAHKMFGNGIVTAMDGETISVNFGGEIKNLMKNYSKLVRIN